MNGYRLYWMRFRLPTFRAALATGLSLWMAVLACLIGCTLPSFAKSGVVSASAVRENSPEQSQSDLMTNMENCPHHSGGNAPAKQNKGEPVPRGGAMSCCPVEVTVASKPNAIIPHVARTHDFAPESDFSSMTVRFFHPLEVVALSWRGGRDTLLETQLLRI